MRGMLLNYCCNALIHEVMMNHAFNEDDCNAREGKHPFLDDTLASAGDSCDSLQVTGSPDSADMMEPSKLKLKCCYIYNWLSRER